jgi:hypothetical protein
MKYWNKQKEYRRQHWVTAPSPSTANMQHAKVWCQQNSSSGKFYFHFTNTRWWFEKSDDALAFSLVWSGR